MPKKKSSPLDAYQAKRDFGKSPEPRPGTPPHDRASRLSFVVHRHDARRLHYDLRLQMGGVLKSWAVPKGFSYNPKDKRLAVRTEDHPLEYENFDGIIPSGQYGAGTMTIWDRGSYEIAGGGDGPAAIAEGKLEIRFFGTRLRGEWHMVKLKDASNEWLLFKSKDRYARSDDESVFAMDLLSANKSSLPSRVEPMLPRRPRKKALDLMRPESAWLYELKLPGQRTFVEKKEDSVRLYDAAGQPLPIAASGIRDDIGRIRADNALLDGAIVCLDDRHLPSRQLLEAALAGDESQPLYLQLWDLLYYEEWDLRGFPLSQRKAALASIVPELRYVRLVDHQRGSPHELLSAVATAGLPGMIAKRESSRYVAGRSADWIELRPPRETAKSAARVLASSTQPEQLGGTDRCVKFTNRQKILWPQDGYTKGDLIDYYDQVAKVLMPHLKDRPLSLTRYPNGIEGDSFYQKDAPAHTPDWVPTVELPSDSKKGSIHYILCHDVETLQYLANLATIQLHPWLSRVEDLDAPDWAVLDLDPFGAPFEDVVTIARTIGDILRASGLRPYLKTSGSKGLHIYLPLAPCYSYGQSRMFCEVVARLVCSRHPKIATVERAKSQRVGKVYLDFLQNRRGQTVVAPYVVRPVPGASVSAPLDWEELGPRLDPKRYNLRTMLDRLEQQGDLFAGVLTDRQELGAAIDRLREGVE